MATLFKNKVVKSVGTKPVDIYETVDNQRATVIGLSLTNLTNSFVYVDILLQDDTSVTGYYLRQTLLPANTSLRAVATGEKLIIGANNKIMVQSSLDDSIDVIISYVEVA